MEKRNQQEVTDRVVDDEVIARYLLGELPAEEQTELERRYFADPELLDRMDAVEDDLIDEYVRQELKPEQRQHFERHFLNEKRLERVRMAEALRTAAPPRASSVRPWALPLAAALFVAALLAIVWLALENRGLRDRVRQAETRPTSSPVVAEQRPTAEPPLETVAPPPPIQLATLVLSPGLTRGDDTPTLVIERDVSAIRLEALLEVEAQRYDATLQRIDGPVVWKGTALSAHEGKLILTIPRDRFRGGEHLLTVTAPELVADYAFAVNLR